MLRRVQNPPNPFVTGHCEYLEAPPRADVEVFEESAKSVLSVNDSPDVPFTWSVNPYRGCQHACAYCYARPTHEYLGLGAGSDFDSKIIVKTNAPELLDAELSRPGWKREVIAFSGVTDCYQPLENIYHLTRRCLEVCRKHRTPVGIVTKSFLVVRDSDLLAAMARETGASVWCSIPFCDDRLARQVEPGAPPPSRRFEAMRRLHQAGIPVGVIVAPLIPGLNDREIAGILQRAAACGARSAAHIPLRLPGRVRDVFLQRLREQAPERAARVEHCIREMRGGRLNDPRFGERMRGSGRYWESVTRLFEVCARRWGLRSPHGKGDRPAWGAPGGGCEQGQADGASPTSSDNSGLDKAPNVPRGHQLALFTSGTGMGSRGLVKPANAVPNLGNLPL